MSRDYVFTAWTQPEVDINECKYYIWGRERCGETDREHYQGFIVFNRTHRIPAAKRILGGGDNVHFEVRRGTRQQAIEYCKKDGEWTEYGELGKRTMSDLLLTDVKTIKKEDPLFYVRYHRGIEKLLLTPKGASDFRTLEVTWLWGPAGCGKTRTVMEMESVYKLDPPYEWWDGYEDENILLLDDYENESIKRGMLLNMLDGYIQRLPTKGGHCYAKWTKVFVTSNQHPSAYMLWDKALERRVTSVRCVG